MDYLFLIAHYTALKTVVLIVTTRFKRKLQSVQNLSDYLTIPLVTYTTDFR